MSLVFSFDSGIDLYFHKIEQNILLALEEIYKIKYFGQSNKYHYLIFKFSNGINIHYFDETLSNKLGYLQKDLLNSPLEKIMPKEVRIPHSCAIIRHIINDRNIYFNNNSIFFFDREMQMYPSTASGICLPGLGKYLFCIFKAGLKKEKNEYFFYLNKNFDCISLSYNFNKNYNISLNLLNKNRMNILELIDFKFEDLEELNKDIDKMNKYKKNMDILTDYFYSQKLFKGKSKYNSSQHTFNLVSHMKMKTQNYNIDNNELKNDNTNKEKINIIENLMNIKHQYNYLINNLMKKKIKRDRKIFVEKIKILNKSNNEDYKNKLISFLSSFLNNKYEKK